MKLSLNEHFCKIMDDIYSLKMKRRKEERKYKGSVEWNDTFDRHLTCFRPVIGLSLSIFPIHLAVTTTAITPLHVSSLPSLTSSSLPTSLFSFLLF